MLNEPPHDESGGVNYCTRGGGEDTYCDHGFVQRAEKVEAMVKK